MGVGTGCGPRPGDFRKVKDDGAESTKRFIEGGLSLENMTGPEFDEMVLHLEILEADIPVSEVLEQVVCQVSELERDLRYLLTFVTLDKKALKNAIDNSYGLAQSVIVNRQIAMATGVLHEAWKRVHPKNH